MLLVWGDGLEEVGGADAVLTTARRITVAEEAEEGAAISGFSWMVS